MTSPILVAVFTVAYLAVTVWLCRGLKLNAKSLALGGLVCALTLILASFTIPLPTGASITCGSWIPLMLLAVVCDRRLAFVSGWVCGILAIFIKFWAHVFSGVIFYSQNAWDGWGAWGYSLAFNLSSRLPEGILSILIVSVLPLTLMRRAIARREAK